jgi:DNA-binding NtrC family response regulator
MVEQYDAIYIDDERDMTSMFTTFIKIKYKAWRFRTYNNSMEAWIEIMEDRVHAKVWLLDIMMPNKDGTVIAEALAKYSSPAPVILGYTALDPLSLKDQPQYKDRLVYFNHIVNKQESISELLELMKMWL